MIETIAQIESALISGLRPHFLIISYNEEFIHVIISHPSFAYKTISQRIRICFNLLRNHDKEILRNHSVIIETYDPDQLNDILNESFL